MEPKKRGRPKLDATSKNTFTPKKQKGYKDLDEFIEEHDEDETKI